MFVRKLRAVQQNLLAQSVRPEICRFNMRYFGVKLSEAAGGVTADAAPLCGTQACIAGETILNAGLAFIPKGGGFTLTAEAKAIAARESRFDEEVVARRLLGLTDEQARRLFYFTRMGQGFGWPKHLEAAYEACTTATGRALIGAQRIELFIQTNGEQ